MTSFVRLLKIKNRSEAKDMQSKKLAELADSILYQTSEIETRVSEALAAGVNRKEIIETIGSAVLMGEDPSVERGFEALEVLNRISNQRPEKNKSGA